MIWRTLQIKSDFMLERKPLTSRPLYCFENPNPINLSNLQFLVWKTSDTSLSYRRGVIPSYHKVCKIKVRVFFAYVHDKGGSRGRRPLSQEFCPPPKPKGLPSSLFKKNEKMTAAEGCHGQLLSSFPGFKCTPKQKYTNSVNITYLISSDCWGVVSRICKKSC